jgi:hypothetical protein
MAKKVTITLVDDLDKTSPADETVSFGLDGVSYEIDLSAANAAKLRDALAVYIGHAERLGGRKSTKAAGSGAKSRGGAVSSVREWARANGYQVSERGRIPADIQAAYDKAHA